MASALTIALSGLNAATTRIDVSANNIANQFSTSTSVNGKQSSTTFTPQVVDQISLSSGGVLAQITNANTASSQGDPTALPQVDSANELIQQNIASYDYKANLQTIKTQNSLFNSLLNILS